MTLFPKRETKAALVAFRPPAELHEYIKSVSARGYSITDTLNQFVELIRDLDLELGADIERIDEMARKEGIARGRMIGRLAKKMLAQQKR